MAMLHLVQGRDRQTLEHCLDRVGEGDAVLLLGDAAYLAVRSVFRLKPRAASGRIRLYVLHSDLEARGLQPGELEPGVTPIDYDGFVTHSVEFHPILSWF